MPPPESFPGKLRSSCCARRVGRRCRRCRCDARPPRAAPRSDPQSQTLAIRPARRNPALVERRRGVSTLYLSRLSLRRDASLAALTPLLLLTGIGAQAGAAHRLIWAAFADDPERKRDFLWRQDEKRRWLVLSSRL